MEKQELEHLKLELEIKELSKYFWQKPAYLTIIVSALTVIITATIGFAQYFSRVDQENVTKIANLQKIISDTRDERIALDNKRRELELFYLDVKAKEMEKQNKLLDASIKIKENQINNSQSKLLVINKRLKLSLNEYANFRNQVLAVVEYYQNYGPAYAKGVVDSPSGQAEILKVVSNTDKNKEQNEVGRFAYGLTSQSIAHITSQIRVKLQLDSLNNLENRR